jgi:hypothetical protein
MRAAAFETIQPNTAITSLPTMLHQTPSRVSPWLMIGLALPAAVAVIAPFTLIAVHAAQEPSLLTDQVERSAILGLALMVWTCVFVWPIAARAKQSAAERRIVIDAASVTVWEKGLFGATTWSEPLHAYTGIAHHVRSSLSGTRHELLLIHADPARALLLRTAAQITQAEIDHLTMLLGCREIAPQVFYRNTQRVGSGLRSLRPEFLAAKA